jgi:hypothetical protein
MSRSAVNIFLAGLATVCLAAATAEAGSMTTFLTVAARYDNAFDFNPLPVPFYYPGIGVPNGYPGVYQIDVSFTAATGAGEKGWANTLFDTGITSGAYGSDLRLDLGLGWTANSNTTDTNGLSTPGGIKPIYATNRDGGTVGDLQAIIASIESPSIISTADDKRNNLGTLTAPPGVQNPPDPGSWIGTFYVDWNGVGLGDVAITNQQFSFTRTDNTFAPVLMGAGAHVTFGYSDQIPPPDTPEPGTLTLACIALVALITFVHGRK